MRKFIPSVCFLLGAAAGALVTLRFRVRALARDMVRQRSGWVAAQVARALKSFSW